MTCPVQSGRAGEILLDYCAQTLPPEQVRQFEPHLASCADCRDAVAGQTAVWNALDKWSAGPPSADFGARLNERLAEEDRRRSWLPAGLRRVWTNGLIAGWAPVLPAGAAVIAVFAFALMNGVSRPVAPSPAPDVRSEPVSIQQVEEALDDIDMLKQLDMPPADRFHRKRSGSPGSSSM